MSYTLYYSPGTASMAVHWMLHQLAVPFDTILIDVETGAQRNPDYLKINPTGRIPTLMIDGQPYGESAALLMLLAERHPEAGLAPAVNSTARPAWMQTMLFLANTVLPSMRDWFYADTDGSPEAAGFIRKMAQQRLEAAWERVNTQLADGRNYLVGDQLSTVDFLAVMLMRWTRNMPRPATTWPHIATYVQHMRAMDSFKTMNAKEGLTDWSNP